MNVKKSTAIASAMTGLLALGAQFIAAPVMAADDKEKCYGVVKAGKNDFAEPLAWALVVAGLLAMRLAWQWAPVGRARVPAPALRQAPLERE